MFKWVKIVTLPTNDPKMVTRFLRKHIFTRFGTPRVVIIDEGSQICNKAFDALLAKYGVKHRIYISYCKRVFVRKRQYLSLDGVTTNHFVGL